MLKNSKRNVGFTLAELICAIGVIGVCAALTFTMIKNSPDDKAVKYLYMNAYNSLNLAFYNANYNSIFAEYGNSPFDEDGSRADICKGLTYYINTTALSDDGYDANCSSGFEAASELADEFDYENPAFIASNSMKFWISDVIGDDTLKFYLVFVDVNGDRKPNSFVYTYKRNIKNEKNKIGPDIFAFALTDTGRVCPIGIPEFDTNILTARYVYDSDDNEPQYSTKALAYYQAKGAAWGFYSKNEDGDENVIDYSLDEVYSLNELIRDQINSNSAIVKDFPTLSNLSPLPAAEGEPSYCADGDYDTCYIVLDRYVP